MKKLNTPLDELIDETAALEAEIAALPRRAKLTGPAFAALALKNAEGKSADLDALSKKLSEPGNEDAARFIRRLRREVCESPSYSVPPDNGLRLVTVYGDPGVLAILNSMKTTPLICLALAARWSAAQVPVTFGTVTDMSEFSTKSTDLFQRRDKLYADIRTAYTAADLLIDADSIRREDRDAGMCRVTFLREPSVSLAARDWPRELVRLQGEKRKAPAPSPEPASPDLDRRVSVLDGLL